jgi:hypothetical protein
VRGVIVENVKIEKDRGVASRDNFTFAASAKLEGQAYDFYREFSVAREFNPASFPTFPEFKNALKFNDIISRLLILFPSDDISAIGKHRLIQRIENDINAAYPKENSELLREKLAADKKLHAEKIKIFQAEINSAFGYPSDNAWQDTLSGITRVSSAVSEDNKREKVRDEDAATINFSLPITETDIKTASYVGEKADGTRVIAVVSGSADVSRLAADTCRVMAQYQNNSAVDLGLNQIRDVASGEEAAKKEGTVDSASYLYISHAPGGRFEVTGAVTGAASVIVFNPSAPGGGADKFSTLARATLGTSVSIGELTPKVLPEDSIVLCLTNETLKYLPERSGGAIDFAKLFTDQGFELPTVINESTLMNALAKHAIKNHHEAEARSQCALVPQQIFISGLTLSNDLKTNPWLNPANWAAPLLVLILGIVFGLNLFAPEAVFTAAAPFLMPIVFGAFLLTGAMLVAYVGNGIYRDIMNQRKNRKNETPVELLPKNDITDEVTQETLGDFANNYRKGIVPRFRKWVTDHSYQFTFGVFITLVMFTLASLALASILNPVGFDTVTGQALVAAFNFIAHTLSQLSQSIPFLQFGVGSITADVLVVVVAALIPAFFLNAIRQIVTGLYERFKDEGLSDVHKVMNPSFIKYQTPRYAVTKENWEAAYYDVAGLANRVSSHCMLKITGYNPNHDLYDANIIDASGAETQQVYVSRNSLEEKGVVYRTVRKSTVSYAAAVDSEWLETWVPSSVGKNSWSKNFISQQSSQSSPLPGLWDKGRSVKAEEITEEITINLNPNKRNKEKPSSFSDSNIQNIPKGTPSPYEVTDENLSKPLFSGPPKTGPQSKLLQLEKIKTDKMYAVTRDTWKYGQYLEEFNVRGTNPNPNPFAPKRMVLGQGAYDKQEPSILLINELNAEPGFHKAQIINGKGEPVTKTIFVPAGDLNPHAEVVQVRDSNKSHTEILYFAAAYKNERSGTYSFQCASDVGSELAIKVKPDLTNVGLLPSVFDEPNTPENKIKF